MSARRRMLDDVARLATGAAGLVQGAGREAETVFRVRLERLLDQMDLVPRDEFDAVKAMAAKTREENEALAARVAELEAAIQSLKRPAGTARKAPKTSAKGAPKTASGTARTARKPRKTADNSTA